MSKSYNRRHLLRQKETHFLLATTAAALFNCNTSLVISADGVVLQIPISDPYYKRIKDVLNDFADTHYAKRLRLCAAIDGIEPAK